MAAVEQAGCLCTVAGECVLLDEDRVSNEACQGHGPARARNACAAGWRRWGTQLRRVWAGGCRPFERKVALRKTAPQWITAGIQPRNSAVLVNMAKTGCVSRFFQAEIVVFNSGIARLFW